MVALAVGNFMAAIKPQSQSEKQFIKDDLLKLKQLTGYGVACSGDGMVGAYKLEMEFQKITSIVTKIELGYRERLNASGLIDFTLNYYQKTMDSLS